LLKSAKELPQSELSLRLRGDWQEILGGDVTKLFDAKQQRATDDVATLEAQIADLKQLVALLQAQLADTREQKDKLQSRAERVSLVLPC
jgi:FtsZ-binding cell division protein ZapB